MRSKWITPKGGAAFLSCHNEPEFYAFTIEAGYLYLHCRVMNGISGHYLIDACFNGTAPPASKPPKNPKSPTSCGSIIQASNQVIGETIPVVGTNFNLVYFSDRVVGRKSDYKKDIQITGSYINSHTTGFDLTIKNEASNTVYSNTYTATNSSYTYSWNGLDTSSNETWGPVKRTFIIKENATDVSFPEFIHEVSIGGLKAKKLGIGGWVPSIWHFYDEGSKTLFKGDGSFRAVTGVADGVYTRIADESGKQVFYFDSTGKISHTKTSITGTTIYTFAYDVNGQLLSIAEPFSRVTLFNRYLDGTIKEIVAPNGKVTTATLDVNLYLSELENPIGETHQMSYYGTEGLIHTFTVPSGDVTTMTYDLNGNLLTDTHTNGFSVTLTRSSTDLTNTSAVGRIVSSVFDGIDKEITTRPSGYVDIKQTSPESVLVDNPDLYEYTTLSDDPRFGDQARFVSALTSVNFGTRSPTYTKTVSLSTPSNPYSITTLTDKEKFGSVTKYTSVYTGSTKTTITTSNLGRTRKVQVDTYERPIVTQRGNLTQKDYTYTNHLLTKTEEGLRETNMTYNADGLLATVTNALGQVTSYTYDLAQRLKTKTTPDSRVTTYNYDYNGNLTSVTPPVRSGFSALGHGLVYGLNDLVTTYQPPLLSGVATVNTSYDYNADKQLTKITRPDGLEINYNYNATTGLLDSLTGAFGTISTDYYTAEKPESITDQYTHNLGMTYTRNTVSGVVMTKGSTNISTYSRTPATIGGKTGSEVLNGYGTSSVSRTVNYSYNNDEELTGAGTMTLAYASPNGLLTGTTLGSVTDAYTYNSFGEITGYQAKYSTTVIYSYTLTRDLIGRVTQKVETLNGVTKTFDYHYDTAGRLTSVDTNSVTTATYVYDQNGNRTGGSVQGVTTTGIYDEQDRLTSYNGVSLAYNANGELLTKGTATYIYDVFGNLNQYVNGSTSISYEIDPLQRRFGAVVGSTLNSRFIYNPEDKVVGQLDNLNKLQKTFVYGTKAHVPDYYINSSNIKFRIITDYLGSVRLVVSNTGVVNQIMEHDEFGRVVQDTSPGLTPFGFAGGLYDYRTGLVRFGARDYDPQTGKWTSKDPIRFDAGDSNLFNYVQSDPTNKIDPTGLDYQICTRPLSGNPILTDQYPLRHDYIRFADGTTISWGPKNGKPVGSGALGGENGANGDSCGKVKVSSSKQDERMKKWAKEHEGDMYNALLNNCRDFVNGSISAM